MQVRRIGNLTAIFGRKDAGKLESWNSACLIPALMPPGNLHIQTLVFNGSAQNRNAGMDTVALTSVEMLTCRQRYALAARVASA